MKIRKEKETETVSAAGFMSLMNEFIAGHTYNNNTKERIMPSINSFMRHSLWPQFPCLLISLYILATQSLYSLFFVKLWPVCT